MIPEADLIPLSALQHYVFCPRQCALIHLEQTWLDNRLTAEGRLLHERVDRGGKEKRGEIRRAYGVPLRSLELGLSGRADVVEFHRQQDGSWRPYPVEHKRGRPKKDWSDRVQLCAQAVSLEEMLGAAVPEGALYYGSQGRREVVPLDAALRARTREVADAVHSLLASGRTPTVGYSKKCDRCSMIDVCLPRKTGGRRGGAVARYLSRLVNDP